MKVYFISGLGADSRVFKHIRLPQGYEMIHLDWLPPNKAETLTAYAFRMAQRIDLGQPFALLGLSMGGMIVSEIAKQYPPQKTILISSVPAAQYLPMYFKWVAKTGVHNAIPIGFIKSSAIAKRFFTSESKADKIVLKQQIRQTDNHFIRWAMNAIVHWDNNVLPDSYIHVHGNKDHILPLRNTKPTHIIQQAGHMMVMTHAEELNEILHQYLS